MQCHKCRWNESSIEEKQAHCPSCKFSECYPLKLHGKADDGQPRVVELDKIFADFTLLNPIDKGENDILHELELEENQVQLIMDFVSAFSSLPLRKRLTALALLEYGGNNTAIMQATGLSRPCVLEHRKFFEADPFWSQMLKRACIFRLKERSKPSKETRGLKKGAKLGKFKKWKVDEVGGEDESIP